MIYRLGIDAYFDISLMQCQEPIYSHSKKTIKTHQEVCMIQKTNSTSEPCDVKFTAPESL